MKVMQDVGAIFGRPFIVANGGRPKIAPTMTRNAYPT
jgi:hypothetical protein